ncbi:hypothetical protein [Mucilaginibacter sp. AK015]|uniref:hypothetical protein n=1 Tax=Mucilaginibacter sp. AK015 TaxID=2723072 RepID=UPI00160BA9A4|nr:hypothetical protein [Mucilaginibacter sp. AK015]MBB5395092.1 hypothetical protein [Mucilaginibacter sp. AK015]
MEQTLKQYILEYFAKLFKVYDFQITQEVNEKNSFMIEFSSTSFLIKIEQYFREFYPTLYKLNKPDSEINLFNLLDYLKRDGAQVPKSNYFKEEKDIEKCYKKQLSYISSVIYENYNSINDFFNDNKYESNMADFENYWKTKHPELYRKV